MKLTIPFESEKEVTIPVPCFWKHKGKGTEVFSALLDDDTYVRVVRHSDDSIVIVNSRPEKEKLNIQRSFLEHDLMTEEEFFQEFSDAFESIRLHPKEVTTANCYSENC